MARKRMPQIHKRVITTSIAIILGFSIAFGFILNQLYVQSYIAVYSSDLVAAVPHIVAELRRDNIVKIENSPLFTEPEVKKQPSNYLAFICGKNGESTWMSSEARKANINDICQFIPDDLSEPDLIYYHDNPYVAHVISEAAYTRDELLIVVRDVQPQLVKLAAIKRQTWMYMALLFLTATGLIYAASFWSFSPLRKLAEELNEITASRREKLEDGYPKELEEVTDALNRMITLQKEQTQRYRHAMDDLAHSLKSRLAATNALLDDTTLSRADMNKRIIEQVSQMDDMVQYQLKRALVGQRGLVREQTELKPTILSLTGMFSKIYSDKPVTISLNVMEVTTLPLNKADLTELLGNLLENAYRFCISEIRISTRETLNNYVLTIEDDGLGVAQDYRESIFQRGVRADQLNPGTGIGLAVCDEIVESYGGKIRVVDSELEGAAFIMTFPKSL